MAFPAHSFFQALGKAMDAAVELRSFGRCQKVDEAGNELKSSMGASTIMFFRDWLGVRSIKDIQICFFLTGSEVSKRVQQTEHDVTSTHRVGMVVDC